MNGGSGMPQGTVPQGGYTMPAMNPNMYGGMMGGMMPMGGMPMMPQQGMPNYNKDYQNFDYVSEGIEPCIIPYIVGYDAKGITVYGNMMEKYATMDRYKFLLTTNISTSFNSDWNPGRLKFVPEKPSST